MRKSRPCPRSKFGVVIGAVVIGAVACNPVAPVANDNGPAPRGQGGSSPPSGSGGSSGTVSAGSGGAPASSGGSGGTFGTTGVTAFASCSSPADMKGVSAADFCAQYMSTCQFGTAAPKYTSVDDCKTKYGGYTGEQKWCVAYHLCKGAENNGAAKDTHCPHAAGGGGDPCKLAASSADAGASDGGGGGGGGGDAQAAAAPSLKSDIYPLFMTKCQKCHMDVVKTAADLYKWLNDNAARPACAPKMMPRKALVLSKTNTDPAVAAACGGKMPVGTMGDADLWAKLKAWVADGAKDN
jgi:hypothetical protein